MDHTPATGSVQSSTSRRTANRRSDVEDAALSLFAQNGYRSTGIRDIAQTLDIGPTSLYSHIDSKAELLRQIVSTTLDELLLLQEEALSSTNDVVQQLRRAIEAQVRYFAEHPRESRVTIADFMWVEEPHLTEVLEQRANFRGRLQTLLAKGRDEDVFDVSDPKIASFAVIEMCEGVVRWFRESGELTSSMIAYLYGDFALRIAGAK